MGICCERAPYGVVEAGGEQVPPSDWREVSGLDDTMMREGLQWLVLRALHLPEIPQHHIPASTGITCKFNAWISHIVAAKRASVTYSERMLDFP